jgi:hypothetical protein
MEMVFSVESAPRLSNKDSKPKPKDPLVREGASQEEDRNCHTSNKDLVVSPKWVLHSKTDWPADRRS